MLSVEYRTTADLVRAFVRSTIAIPTGLQNIFNTKHVNVFIYMLQTKSPRSYNAGKLRVDSKSIQVNMKSIDRMQPMNCCWSTGISQVHGVSVA